MHQQRRPQLLRPARQQRVGGRMCCSVYRIMVGVVLLCVSIMAIALRTLSSAASDDNGNGTAERIPGRPQPKQKQGAKTKTKPKKNQQPEANKASPDGSPHPRYHMVFSTGCSSFQDWQSYAFFYFAHRVDQPGTVTRIASGCGGEAEESKLADLHEKNIHATMSTDFHIHFTPDFSGPDKYKYYNKPFGIRHWMEHALGYPSDEARSQYDDDIIMILDPDQMLLRKMTHDFSGTNAYYYDTNQPKVTKVQHGHPFASVYAFGDQPFTRVNLTHVMADPQSPMHRVSRKDGTNHYPAGPPYLATLRDMYSIVTTWTEFVPRVHEVYPGLLGEMFAYSLAAAHQNLPHQLVPTLMVSDVNTHERMEGWRLVDSIEPSHEVCVPDALHPEDMPSVLHYCQNYWLGKWFFGKYRLHRDFLTCGAPLLAEPPPFIVEKYDFYIRPGGKPAEYGTKVMLPRHERGVSTAKRLAFMLCRMIRSMNEVATFYKEHHCGGGGGGGEGDGDGEGGEEEGKEVAVANYEKTYVFHRSMDPGVNDYVNYGERVFSDPYTGTEW